MKIEYLKNLVEYHNLNPTEPLKINLFEKEIRFCLPLAFKEFLYLTGADYDMLLRGGGGMPQNIDTLSSIHFIAKSILKDCNTSIDNFFPFVEYNDQFLFFYINDGDDPPIYRFETELFHSGDTYITDSSNWGLPEGVLKVAESFSEMISRAINVSDL